MTPTPRLLLPLLGVGALVATVAFALLVPAFAAEPDSLRFSAYRDGPLDAQRWRQVLEADGYETRSVLSSSLASAEFDDPTRVAWVVLGPERPYRSDEAAALQRFIGHGGNLLVADSGGFGNQIVAQLPIRFGPSSLLDERFQGNRSFVVAEGVVGSLTYPLLLNNPVALIPADEFNGTVIVRSSASSYLDVDDNGRVDQTDVPGPFPVVASWTTPAGGAVILSADVGLFLQAALDLDAYQHAPFHRALASKLLPEGGLILVDESVHSQGPRLDAIAATNARILSAAQHGVSWLIVGAGFALAALLTLLAKSDEPWRRHKAAFPLRPLGYGSSEVARATRDAALRILSRLTGIPSEQLYAMGDAELAAISPDPLWVRGVHEPASLSADELEQLVAALSKTRNTS